MSRWQGWRHVAQNLKVLILTKDPFMPATNPSLPRLPNCRSPAAMHEREEVYSFLDVWADEDTQVSSPVPMSELVNGAGTEPRNTNHLKVADTAQCAEAPCKAPDNGRNAQ